MLSWFCLAYCGELVTLYAAVYLVVIGAIFITGGVLVCNFTHLFSVAVLSMQYMIRSKPAPLLVVKKVRKFCN